MEGKMGEKKARLILTAEQKHFPPFHTSIARFFSVIHCASFLFSTASGLIARSSFPSI